MSSKKFALDHYLHSSQAHSITRHWQSQGSTTFSPKDFVLPLFVLNDDDGKEPCPSFPGINRMGCNVLIEYLKPLVNENGLSSVLLFAALGSDKKLEDATNEQKNPVLRIGPLLKKHFPNLLLIADVCLCTFSEDGHCCVFDQNGRMDNEKSIQILADISVKYGKAQLDIIAPSDMMDTRIGAIRNGLDSNGLTHVSILSYAAKFESCFYGPFRGAAGSAPKYGDRKCYQLPAGSKGMALRATERDIKEGADMVMVKPALAYLDVVSSIAHNYPNLPIAVYHVSGEYTMLVEAADKGTFDLKKVVTEVTTSFKRAGASVIISYFTPMILAWIKSGEF